MNETETPEFVNLPMSSATPFPQLVDVQRSTSTVQILKDLAYDRHSEMTAATTYMHQDWQLYPQYPKIANALEQIAITEMTHLDALSNAIVAFGGNADYVKDGDAWTARWVDLGTSLPEMLQRNIDAENKAIQSYERAIGNVSNESLKAIFRKIIEDEQAHIAIFSSIINYLQNQVE